MVHQTFVWWALYILYRLMKFPSRQLSPPIGNVRCVWRFSSTLINTFIHFIHVVKKMHKRVENTWKNTNLAWKVFFWSPVSFSKSIFNYGWGSEMPSCNITPYQWCLYWLLGLKWRPQGGTQNKQRASVRLYWLSSPLTACRPRKYMYPVSASIQSTNSTKVFDALCLGFMQFMHFFNWWAVDFLTNCIECLKFDQHAQALNWLINALSTGYKITYPKFYCIQFSNVLGSGPFVRYFLTHKRDPLFHLFMGVSHSEDPNWNPLELEYLLDKWHNDNVFMTLNRFDVIMT